MAKKQATPSANDAGVEQIAPDEGGVAVAIEATEGTDTGIENDDFDFADVSDDDLWAELGVEAPDREEQDEASTAPEPPPEEPEEVEVEETEDTEEESDEEETADAAEEEDEDEPEMAEPPKRKPGAEKRIDELTYKLRSAEELAQTRAQEVEAIRAELEAAKNQPSAPVREIAADYFGADAETASEIQRYEDILAWTERNPNGGMIRGQNGEEIDVEERQVTTAAAEAKAYLGTQKALGRQRFSQVKQLAERDAQRLYPEMANRTSELAKFEKLAIEAIPSIRNRPDYRLWIGRMWRGYMEERKAQEAQAAPPPPASRPVVKAVRPPKTAAVRTKRHANPNSVRDRHLADLRARADDGDAKAMEEYLELTL